MKKLGVSASSALLFLSFFYILAQQSVVSAKDEMDKALSNEFVNQIQEIFSNYYVALEKEVRKSRINPPDDEIQQSKIRLEGEYNKFWLIPEFIHISNREKYFKKIQEHLRESGYFLDITPQYGVDSGNLHLETVDNISLRPIFSVTEKKSHIGSREIEYTEFILGESLIALPHFIEPIVETASSSEISIFPDSLYKTLEDNFNNFKEFQEEGDKRFKVGVLSSDNLFCVQLRLHKRQWGIRPPDNKDLDHFINLFRLHGEQHILDFKSIDSKVLNFILEDLELDESLNKDSVLEARVMVRQLLEKLLPYNVLSQIITYQREWMQGSRSEYAWAGHIIFEGFSKKLGYGLDKRILWTTGVENLTEEEIYRIALRFAYNNRNFMDMLTVEQFEQSKSFSNENIL